MTVIHVWLVLNSKKNVDAYKYQSDSQCNNSTGNNYILSLDCQQFLASTGLPLLEIIDPNSFDLCNGIVLVDFV